MHARDITRKKEEEKKKLSDTVDRSRSFHLSTFGIAGARRNSQLLVVLRETDNNDSHTHSD